MCDQRAQTTLVRLRGQLRAACPGLKARWVDDNDLHLTLRFLGALSKSLGDLLPAAIGAVTRNHRAIEVWTQSLQWWPSVQQPRALVVTMQPAPALNQLAQEIDCVVTGIGVAADTRPFRSHITLARIAGEPIAHDVEHIQIGGIALLIDQVSLVQSQLQPGASRYSPLTRWPLSAAGPDSGRC